MINIGDKFGELTVVDNTPRVIRKSATNIKKCVLCRCSCGVERDVSITHLTTNHTKSCGHLQYPTGINNVNFKDIREQKFHMLTVISLDRFEGGKSYWNCKCDCGNTLVKQSGSIGTRDKAHKSCGCLNTRTGKNNPCFKGYEDISGQMWCQIKNGSRKRDKGRSRNIEFNITIEQAWNIFIRQERKCALSGVNLCFQSRGDTRDGTASLDRIDSTIGYLEKNCQWIHKDLQPVKMDMEEDKLMSWIKSIYEYNNLNKTTNISEPGGGVPVKAI